MVRRFPLPIWTGWFAGVNSLLVSTVCHLTALVAVGLVVTTGPMNSPEAKLAIDLSEGTDLPANDDALLRDGVRVGVASGDAAVLGPVRLFDDVGVAAGDFGSINAPTGLAASESGMEGTALADFGDAAGKSGKSGPAGKSATDFFGIDGYGQTFVYVVDCSGSMSENGKFERAVYELLQSIEQLSSEQRYYIIFYNHRAYPMDSRGPVAATQEQFEKTRSWVEYARPQGGTVPLPALLAALSMKPDAIFFLSDGLFDPQTGREVSMHNRGKARQIPIHTIAFVNRENEGLMQTIARNSGGKYRFVQ